MVELIPAEAIRYIPTGDKVYIGSEKSIIRFIFYKTVFTDFELEKLLEFKKYLSTQKTKPLPQTFTDEELIRTIIGCKFNYKKSLEAINSAIL